MTRQQLTVRLNTCDWGNRSGYRYEFECVCVISPPCLPKVTPCYLVPTGGKRLVSGLCRLASTPTRFCRFHHCHIHHPWAARGGVPRSIASIFPSEFTTKVPKAPHFPFVQNNYIMAAEPSREKYKIFSIKFRVSCRIEGISSPAAPAAMFVTPPLYALYGTGRCGLSASFGGRKNFTGPNENEPDPAANQTCGAEQNAGSWRHRSAGLGRKEIGASGLEPPTSCTPCKRASQTAPRPGKCVL